MGWTTLRKRNRTVKEILIEEIKPHELVYSLRKSNTYYTAIKNPINNKIYACVFLFKDDKQNDEFSYKDMTEDCGPYCYGANEKLLSLLSETDNETSKQWREHCKKINNVKKNTIIYFKQGICAKTKNPENLKYYFIYLHNNLFLEPSENKLYKIKDWELIDFDIFNNLIK